MATQPRHETVEDPPSSLLAQLRSAPERAPETIALAAAERFAEPARRYVARVGARGHPPDWIAHHAVRRHTRLARVEGAVTGVGGALTAIPDLVGLAWIQSRMVFFVAATYGYDPGHPMRPAELLALQDIYETPADARAALDRQGPSLAVAYAASRLTRSQEKTLQRRLLGFVSRKVALRMGSRFVPLLSSATNAVQNGRLTADLGERARRYYGGS